MGLDYLLSRTGRCRSARGRRTPSPRHAGAEEAEVQFLFVNFSTSPTRRACTTSPASCSTTASAAPTAAARCFSAPRRAGEAGDPRQLPRASERCAGDARRRASRPPHRRPDAAGRADRGGAAPGPGRDKRRGDPGQHPRHRRHRFPPCGTARMGGENDRWRCSTRNCGCAASRGWGRGCLSLPAHPLPNIQPAVMLVAERCAGFMRASA